MLLAGDFEVPAAEELARGLGEFLTIEIEKRERRLSNVRICGSRSYS